MAVNYYDDYSFTDTDKPSMPSSILGQTVTTRTNGLATSSWVKTLNQNSWTKTYTFYDEKARSIREYSKNYLGGTTIIDSELHFSGIPLKTVGTHKKLATDTPVTITNNFEYDHASRLKKQTQQINNDPVETIAINTYDGIGMLMKKEVGGKSNPLQKVDYTYNVRGELTNINDVNSNLGSSSDNDLFAYKLNYENPVEGTANVSQLFNGTITQSIWRNKITDEKQAYSYEFDKLNRIASAQYRKGTNLSNDASKFTLSGISYDKDGNIKTLQRTGTSGQIDNLTYNYETVGVETNKLVDVVDTSNNSEGYKDTNASGNNYTYDSNGRLTADQNKGISSIAYNHLDLPDRITFTNGNYVEIVYDASGNKLEKLYVTSGGTTKTLYINGFQYQDNQLQFFGNSEGYTYKDGSSYRYAYIYTDHLGNNRLSYSDTNGNGTISTSEIFSKTDYYPFGLKHKGYNDVVSSNGNSVAQKFGYNGKELNEELGLEWHDFGARNFDASLGRWMNLDPLAEKMRRHSPYNYAFNNPIFWVDPDGMEPCADGENCEETKKEEEPDQEQEKPKEITQEDIDKIIEGLPEDFNTGDMLNAIVNALNENENATIKGSTIKSIGEKKANEQLEKLDPNNPEDAKKIKLIKDGLDSSNDIFNQIDRIDKNGDSMKIVPTGKKVKINIPGATSVIIDKNNSIDIVNQSSGSLELKIKGIKVNLVGSIKSVKISSTGIIINDGKGLIGKKAGIKF